ncbi:MAG: MarR family transcriptional regulator [Sphingopyxis sp.]|nr:MarR family transcriptional regulator [Sphingopyxis sp.]
MRVVGLAVRRMQAQGVLSSAAMAKHFALHPSDLEVLDIIFVRESVSAGDLVKATGLTSGSITSLLDRLETRGLILRERDAADRRRTLVRLNRAATAPIEAAYEPRQTAMHELWSQFDAASLEAITDFLTRSTDLLVACTAEIADLPAPAEHGCAAAVRPAPLRPFSPSASPRLRRR